jgi:hypothetical protein
MTERSKSTFQFLTQVRSLAAGKFLTTALMATLTSYRPFRGWSSRHNKLSDTAMKFKSANLHELLEHNQFVPQAIIAGTVDDLTKRLHVKLEKNTDDFDEYVGTAFWYGETPVALMRYAGHPDDQYTIYLPFKIQGVDKITRMVHDIVSLLKLPDRSIIWERKDDPDL